MPADSAFLGMLIEAGSKAAISELSKAFVARFKSLKISTDDLKSALENHLESTFERCAYVKTVLRDNRERFDHIYCPQSFQFGNKRYSQTELVDFIEGNRATVIVGSGGSGKSMFVRYLWLYYFGYRKDKLPIFMELRNLNSSTHNSFVDFLYYSAVQVTRNFSQAQFLGCLERGEVVVFLDGFDEVNHANKARVQDYIIEIRSKFPKLNLVVTSRNDDRFIGWQQFDTVYVNHLTKEECIQVLRRAPFNAEDKEQFILKVDKSLFDKYRSFLSNPLLCYMTLVTYSYNPNFTDRMHEFYEMAFEALFYRHDLTKGGSYQRELYTKLTKAEFQRLMSYFCLRTYFDEKVEFSESEILSYMRESKQIESRDFGFINEGDFLRDAIECVCIMKKDGFDYSFTHRKFQEYFAAYCLARVTNRNIESLLLKFAARHEDDVFKIVYDLNSDLFREKFIVPTSKKYKSFFHIKNDKLIMKRFASLCGLTFQARVVQSSKYSIGGSIVKDDPQVSLSVFGNSDFYNVYTSLRRISPSKFEFKLSNDDIVNGKQFLDLLLDKWKESKYMYASIAFDFDVPEIMLHYDKDNDLHGKYKVISVNSKLWKSSAVFKYVYDSAICMQSFVCEERQIFESVSEKFTDYFPS